MKIDFITYYDLDDNIIAQFDNYKECAKYFNTTEVCIRCYISRKRLHYNNRKKRDKETKKWGTLEVTYLE